MRLATTLKLSLLGIALVAGCSQNTAEPKSTKGESNIVTEMDIQSEPDANE